MILDPKLLGFWVRCIRQSQNISQEALAASSSIDVRTIQRFEAGRSVSITTRRCLAKALGYENQDIFDEPTFAATVHQIFDEMESLRDKAVDEQHPDFVRVKTARVKTGDALGRFADVSNAVLLHADEELAAPAKEMVAVMFDYVRDLMDCGDVPYSHKLDFNKALEAMLRDLESQGNAVYSAFRNVKMTNKAWSSETPLALNIGYLTVVPAQKQLDEMFVPRQAALG